MRRAPIQRRFGRMESSAWIVVASRNGNMGALGWMSLLESERGGSLQLAMQPLEISRLFIVHTRQARSFD